MSTKKFIAELAKNSKYFIIEKRITELEEQYGIKFCENEKEKLAFCILLGDMTTSKDFGKCFKFSPIIIIDFIENCFFKAFNNNEKITVESVMTELLHMNEEVNNKTRLFYLRTAMLLLRYYSISDGKIRKYNEYWTDENRENEKNNDYSSITKQKINKYTE